MIFQRTLIDERIKNLMTGPLSRREVLRRAIYLGASIPVAASLLAACEDDDDAPAVDADTDDEVDEPDVEPDDDPEDDSVEVDDDDDEEVADPPPATPDGSQVNIVWRHPANLHPLFANDGNVQNVMVLIFGALVKMNNEGSVVQDLAETIEAAEDATSFTFRLYEDITFSDGEPLTSEDVKFTFERGVHPETASYWRGILSSIEGADAFSDDETDNLEGVTTPDDTTVEVALAQPRAAFLADLVNVSGLGIIPKHVLEDVAPGDMLDHSFAMEPTPGAGAYKFVQYATDQFLELERNEDYFRGAPAIERIFLRNITPSVAVAQLETGEVDIVSGVPISEVERLEHVEHIRVASVPSLSMDFLALNMDEPKLQDKRVRQAMAWAIDNQGIVDAILEGHGVARHSPIFGPDWMGTPEGLTEYEYNPDRARELLDEAEWDTEQRIEVIMDVEVPDTHKTQAAIIQQQCADVGIQLDLVEIDRAEINARTIQTNDFEIRSLGGGVFGSEPSVSGTYLTTAMHVPAGGNYGHYTNEQVDELYSAAQATSDQDERRAIYTEIAQILNDELPWIFLHSPNNITAISNRVQGYEPAAYVNTTLWNAHEWTLVED